MTRGTRKKRWLVVGAAVCGIAVLVALGVVYAIGGFSPRGKISADDVCPHTPGRGKVAETLGSVLPKASSYSFRDRWSPKGGMGFRNSCTVRGDGKVLLLLTAEPNTVSTWQDWQQHSVDPEDQRGLSRFPAGEHAVANSTVAALAVQCSPYEEMEGAPPVYLTVVAQANRSLDVSGDKARSALVRLATDFARQAHKDARCDLPSRLPEG
ncbi:hypothetical protein CAC01_13920 [Streptomyces sp. CLI2509]|nr:hypothetical protein CAC01_13920 [Streptomyces sp. CLI2509]MYX23626.1 hypothetical protein [Streptomyces sp. SID8380]